MEKNWIETVKEFIRKAMNKGLSISGYKQSIPWGEYKIWYDFEIDHSKIVLKFDTYDDSFTIHTPNGFYKTNYKLTKRDELELEALILSIDEYREDMAISEFNAFFNDMDKPTDINDLDNDDE